MSYQTRKAQIFNLVQQQGSVDIPVLAGLFKISALTIRRDLNQMAQEGLLLRTHGGAVKLENNPISVSFLQKAASNADKKDELCKKAAALIHDGDVVFLDCGSTVFRMCSFLKQKRIQVITNSLPILNELLGSVVQVNFVGGEMNSERQASHGKIALEHIHRYPAHKAFLGVDGISIKFGLSAHSENEAELSLAMMKQAQTSYFLCDSTKFEKDAYLPFAGLRDVTTLITDSGLSLDIKLKYQKKGVLFI
jgi:DeoR family transcriptional regulator, fructose operon transcriptional repressor